MFKIKSLIVYKKQIKWSLALNGLAPLSNIISHSFFKLKGTLGVAVPTH